MYKISYITIIFLITCIIFVNSVNTGDSSSDEIINLYFNNVNGNDQIGNGSINNPFKSLCILNNNPILNQQQNSNIILNIEDTGTTYNSSQCTLSFTNFKNILIKSTTNGNTTVLQMVNIGFNFLNSSLTIENLNFKTDKQFNELNGIKIEGSKVTFKNVELDYLDNRGNYNHYFKNSLINFNDMSKYYSNSVITYIMNCNFNFDNGLISNTHIVTYSEQGEDDSTFTISKSHIQDSHIEQSTGNILISNCSLSSSILNNKVITTSLPIITVNSGEFTILNSTITSVNGNMVRSNIIIRAISLTTVTINGLVINNFKIFDSLLVCTQCKMNITNIQFNNCESSTFLKILSNSNLVITGLSITQSSYFQLLSVSSSKVTISNFNLTCDNGNLSFDLIDSYYNQLSPRGNEITIQNSNLYCVNNGGLSFNNSNILLSNVIIETNDYSFSLELLNLVTNVQLVMTNCKIGFYSYSSYLIVSNGNSNSISISNSIFTGNSPIIKSISNSNISISFSNFTNIKQITNLDQFSCLNNCILLFSNCNFESNLLIVSNLISLDNNSTLVMNDCKLDKLSFGEISMITSTGSSTSIFNNLIMSQCYTQGTFFDISNSSNFKLVNGQFNKNIAFQNGLFQFSSGNEIILTNCIFTNNIFTPVFSSVNSSAIKLDTIEYNNNTGSFYSSDQDTNVLITSFQFTNNLIPPIYLFKFDNCKSIQFDNSSISSNHLTQYLIYISLSVITISDLQFTNNIISHIREPSPFNPTSSYSGYHVFKIQFSNITISNSLISENIITNSNLFEFYNNNLMVFNDCDITNNSIDVSSKLIESNNNNGSNFKSIALFLNTRLVDNYSEISSLISTIGNIIIDQCDMSSNTLGQGTGTILTYSAYSIMNNYFQIVNSNFNENKQGGVFLFSNFDQDAFTCNSSVFKNNTITNNKESAIYTDYFPFSNNLTEIYQFNTFENNTSINGNDFSSFPKTISPNQLYIQSSEKQLITYYIMDYYNRTSTNVFGYSSIVIKSQEYTGTTSYITSRISNGVGTFVFKFRGLENYTLSFKDQNFPSISVTLFCLPQQYFNTYTQQCEFCPLGSSFSESKSGCYKCDPTTTTCIDSMVSTIDNYYLVYNDVALLYQCPLDLCLNNSQCTNNDGLNIGNLCYYCIDPTTSYDNEGDGINWVDSKYGIQCCTHFKPILIIPLVVVFVTVSLLLSYYKYIIFDNNSLIPTLVIYFQINSVIFFSYNGIYILPLFRISIDMIQGYCLFRSLNYNWKVLISFIQIISIIIIGYSDISIKLIMFYFKLVKFKNVPKQIKRIIILNSRNNTSGGNSNNFKLILSILKLMFIPIMFNCISTLSSKSIIGVKLLTVDFSIEYLSGNNKFHIFLFIISILVTTIISTTIIYSKLSKLLPNWEIVNYLKSTLFCCLSITMIFNMDYYILLVLTIQIIYSICYFLITPIKWKRNNYKFNFISNFINLYQLLLFIISNSTLTTSTLSPFKKGLTLSILSFSIIIFYLILNYGNLIKRNKTK